MSKQNWLVTDEALDVLGSVRHTLRCLDFVKDDTHAWKWVILSLHGALQGACVCHLSTTAIPVGAVERHNAIEWSKYFEARRTNPDAKLPDTRLMNLPDLLKTVRREGTCGSGWNEAAVKIDDNEINWLIRIHNECRNQLMHFSPTGWSIEVSGVPRLATLVTRIIGEIYSIGWAFRHLEEEERMELSNNLRLLSNIHGAMSIGSSGT